MGFFSWKTSDTGRSIANIYSRRKTFPVYLIKPDGSWIEEPAYEGYGEFGGHDVFELILKWNAPEQVTGDPQEDRIKGINLYYDVATKNLKHPIILLERKPKSVSLENTNYEPAPDDPCQGYFY